MDPDLVLDDLPADARDLIGQAENDVNGIRDRSERQMDEIRSRADRAVSELQTAADNEVTTRQRQLLEVLKPLQDRYAKEGKLDEALAIRDRIRSLKATLLRAEPDPGSLSMLPDREPGARMLYEVTGSTDGMVWGTDVYTGDSTLAAAAVHAGVLRSGERGVIRVVFVDTLNVAFTGSQRHGVWSEDYAHWPVGFRIERP